MLSGIYKHHKMTKKISKIYFNRKNTAFRLEELTFEFTVIELA